MLHNCIVKNATHYGILENYSKLNLNTLTGKQGKAVNGGLTANTVRANFTVESFDLARTFPFAQAMSE